MHYCAFGPIYTDFVGISVQSWQEALKSDTNVISAIFFQAITPVLLLLYFLQGTRTALGMMARGVVVVGLIWIIRTLA